MAQISYDVPLPLKIGSFTSNGYLDGVLVEKTSGGYSVSSILTARYRVSTKVIFDNYEEQTIYLLANYNFDDRFNLQDSNCKVIDFRIGDGEHKIADNGTTGLASTLATKKDMITLNQAKVTGKELDARIYPAKTGDSLSKYTFKNTKPIIDPKDYPNLIYDCGIKYNIFGKVKGFRHTELRLKPDEEREKIRKSILGWTTIKEYKSEEKKVKFDYFLDDPKNDKLRIAGSNVHELTGDVVACIGHPEKMNYQKFSFWGFDKDGKVRNSYYKEFSTPQDLPDVVSTDDSQPLFYERIETVQNYFFPYTPGDSFTIVEQDKFGKIISDKAYPATIKAGLYMSRFIEKDNSKSFLTIHKKKEGVMLNNFFISPDDKLSTVSFILDTVDLTQPFSNRYYEGKIVMKMPTGNKAVLYQQYYEISITETPGGVAKKIKKYDGFFIASFDKSNKLVDIFQLKSLNKEGGEEPFSADYYQGADGSQVILVHRPNKMKSSKGLIDIKEYVLLNIDLNGKVINKKNLGLKLSRREDILSPTGLPNVFSTKPNSTTNTINLIHLTELE